MCLHGFVGLCVRTQLDALHGYVTAVYYVRFIFRTRDFKTLSPTRTVVIFSFFFCTTTFRVEFSAFVSFATINGPRRSEEFVSAANYDNIKKNRTGTTVITVVTRIVVR